MPAYLSDARSVRSLISIIIVVFSLLVIGVLAFLPLFTGAPWKEWTEVYSRLISPLTGVLGTVLGYWLGVGKSEAHTQGESPDTGLSK